MDLPPLDAVLRCDAFGRPQLQLVGEERDEDTAAPVGHLPLEEVLVPVTDLEAGPATQRLVGAWAVGVVGGPALQVNAPHASCLNPIRTAHVSHALTPLTWGEERGESITASQTDLKHEHNHLNAGKTKARIQRGVRSSFSLIKSNQIKSNRIHVLREFQVKLRNVFCSVFVHFVTTVTVTTVTSPR